MMEGRGTAYPVLHIRVCMSHVPLLPLPAVLSLPRPGQSGPGQSPKVTWLFLGLDFCQLQRERMREGTRGGTAERGAPDP